MTTLALSPERRGSSTSAQASNPLDAVLPRDLLNHLVRLYFDYVSWIIPYPHRPSFEHDLANRREESRGQDEWVATVFGLITYALSLPRQILPLEDNGISALGTLCFDHLMSFLRRGYDVYSADRCEWSGACAG